MATIDIDDTTIYYELSGAGPPLLFVHGMCGDAEVTRYEAVSVAVFLALATGGSVLTYNASLPWVYHEVYAWAVPLVIGAMYWMIRVQREPSRWTIGWLAAFALCSIMTRTTGGWAVCRPRWTRTHGASATTRRSSCGSAPATTSASPRR